MRSTTLRKPFEFELEDEELATFVRIVPSRREKAAMDRSRKKKKPPKKASFESSTDVQRWLVMQGLETAEKAEEESGQNGTEAAPLVKVEEIVGKNGKVMKPPFEPSLVASRRDGPWILSSLTPFYNQDLITDVLHEAHSGKEATVFCCAAHPSTGAEYLAVKIYRPRMFRGLRNDAIYRFSRVGRDEQGKADHGNSRRGSAATRKTEKARSAQVASWIGYEYITQRMLYEHGADVPQTFAQIGNAVLMEYIGGFQEPAPRLSDVRLEADEAEPLFACIMRNIELALNHGRIHGDLSAYNILYWEGKVKVIDFAQAVDPYHNSDVFSLLLRDVERVCKYFARYGIKANARELAYGMWLERMGPLPDMV